MLFVVSCAGIILFCQHIFEDWSYFGILLFSFGLALLPTLIFRKLTGRGKRGGEFTLVLTLFCGVLLFIMYRLSKVTLF